MTASSIPQVAAPHITTILGPNCIVTGVRGAGGANVVLTGSVIGDNTATALLYLGPLEPSSSGIAVLQPAFPGQTVTSSTLYGPDTWVFDPDLGTGNVRAVGSYQYAESSARNHGMIYEGPPSGSGGWSQIDVPGSAVGGAAVWNTIAHSTMGGLVVGNYDLEGVPGSANAFIFEIATKRWTIFALPGCDLTTAYGIWQNARDKSRYTIVGGTRDGHGINRGFVISYSTRTREFSQFKLYSYLNQPGLLTHFEGVTEFHGNYNLAGQTTGAALLATIYENPDGSYSDASWVPFTYPGAALTTGNTVYQDTLMGLFTLSGSPAAQSYAATFEP
jgi:hypothetical protein